MSLNWKELKYQVQEIRPSLIDARIQKIAQTGSFAVGEAVLLQGYSYQFGAWRYLIALRNHVTFMGLLTDAVEIDFAKQATTFVMVLRKYLEGQRILDFRAVDGERVLLFELENKKVLAIELIPRRSNLILLEEWDEETLSGKCLGSYRRVSLQAGGIYSLPQPTKEFTVKEIRDFSEGNGETLNDRVVNTFIHQLENESFLQQKQAWLQSVKSAKKKIATALRNTQSEFDKIEKVESYREQAMVLSEHLFELGAKKFPNKKQLELERMEDGTIVKVHLDLNLSYSQNAEKLFKQVKKLGRANLELESRLETLNKKMEVYEQLQESIENSLTAEALQKFQAPLLKLKLISEKEGARSNIANKQKNVKPKPYLELSSSDGFTILCGRNQLENRAVTFKESKGMDVWMHLKGQPGAHVVIKAQKNKTVPLTTLLEAAQLVLYYSKIRKGKKADIDYTFRKNVRAIKGTVADVTYTDNKALYVEYDAAVLKQILRDNEL